MSNVDKNVKEITWYKISQRKRDKIITDLTIKALSDRELRQLRDKYKNRRAMTYNTAKDSDGYNLHDLETREIEGIN